MNVKHRIFSMLLCIIMLCTLFSFSVNAEVAAGMEEAILYVKSKIGISDYLSEFESDLFTDNGGTGYNLSWYSPGYDEAVYVTINDRMNIIEYSADKRSPRPGVKFPTYSKAELADKAVQWLSGLNPEWIDELQLRSKSDDVPNIYSDRDYVYFERYVNGVKFLNDYVSITLSNRTGDIIHMSSKWTYDDAYIAPDKAMPETDAAEKFYEASPLELIYILKDDKAILVYEPSKSNVKIDAQSGEVLNTERWQYSYDSAMKNEASAEAASGGGFRDVSLSPAEINQIAELNDLKTQDELVSAAKALVNTGLDKAELANFRYYKSSYSDDSKSYDARMSFIFNKDTRDEYDGHVTLDARTGELISLYIYDYKTFEYEGTDKEKLSQDTALANANEFASQNAAKYLDKTILDEKADSFSYVYTRAENGVKFPANSFSIDVDPYTGKIRSYVKNWTDSIEFETTDGIIDVDAAKNKFAENIGFSLEYVYSYDEVKDNDEKIESKISLCYAINNENGSMISAKDGNSVIFYDEPEKVYPNDTKGHYAEEQINALIRYGIITPSDSFRPDEQINHRELAAMTARLIQRGSIWDIDEICSFALGKNIISDRAEFVPDKPAVRSDGVCYIIKALGYGEIADISGMFKSDFSDTDAIAPNLLGYVSMAKGLGIVKGDENGNFNPNEKLTRADTAIMIYNYLAR